MEGRVVEVRRKFGEKNAILPATGRIVTARVCILVLISEYFSTFKGRANLTTCGKVFNPVRGGHPPAGRVQLHPAERRRPGEGEGQGILFYFGHYYFLFLKEEWKFQEKKFTNIKSKKELNPKRRILE